MPTLYARLILLLASICMCLHASAQSSAIQVSFFQPAAGATFDASVPVNVSVTSTYELQAVHASIGSVQSNLVFQSGRWTNSLRVAGLQNGTNTLVVSAQDVFGFVGQTQRIVVVRHDGPPTIEVIAPIHSSVVRSQGVYVEAAAVDDVSANCTITVSELSGAMDFPKLLLRRSNVVKEFVFPTGNRLLITAEDEAGHSVSVLREFVRERNSNLVEIATAPGRLLDYTATQYLCTVYTNQGYYDSTLRQWTLGDPRVAIVDRASSAIATLPATGDARREPAWARLTREGAFSAFTNTSHMFAKVGFWQNGFWRDIGLSYWPDYNLQMVGELIAFSHINGGSLILRDLTNVTNEFRLTNTTPFARLASNGDLLYTTGYYGAIFRSSPLNPANPFGERAVSMVVPREDGQIFETDGTNIVYVVNGKIMLWTPTGEQVVSTNAGSFLLNNGWLAFSRPGSSGQLQIWVRSPSGELSQRTFYGSSSLLESLGPNGALTFIGPGLNPPGRYLSRPGSQPFNISLSHGQPRWTDNGDLRIVLGNSLFGLNAGNLRVLPMNGGISVMSLTGPPGQVVEVQSSANLVSWSSVGLVTNTSGNSWFTNQAASHMQFYRACLKP